MKHNTNYNGIKLEITTERKLEKNNSTNMYRINNILLNNQGLKEEIKQEIKKENYLETNENTTLQNLWDVVIIS